MTTKKAKKTTLITSSKTSKSKAKALPKSAKSLKISTSKTSNLKTKKAKKTDSKSEQKIKTKEQNSPQHSSSLIKKNKISKSQKGVEPRTVVAEVVDDESQLIDQQNDDEAYANHENGDDFSLGSQSEPEANLLPAIQSETSLTTTDTLTAYLNEIRKYPVLSKEEEQIIAKKYYETKDPEAAQALVRANLRFVVKIAAEYARFSNRMIDLIQEGNVGLMHAVKDYNPYKGARLITYAVWWIRGYIQEYLMRQFSMVRIGTTANQRKLFYQLQKQKAELEKMSSPDNIAQISQDLGIPEDEVSEMAKRLIGRDVSLDKTTDDDDSSGVSLGQLLRKDDGNMPLDEQLALAEQLEFLKQAIDQVKDNLTPKEKIILDERVLNEEPLTLQEIGDKYKITREAVRQNEVRLINKIKSALEELMSKKTSPESKNKNIE